MIKLMIFSWVDYLNLSGEAQCNHQGLHEREIGRSVSKRCGDEAEVGGCRCELRNDGSL